MAKRDRLYVGPANDAGQHPYLRDRDGKTSVGLIGDSVEGAQGHLELRHVEGTTFDVVEDIRYTSLTPKSGPPKVATENYRKNWGNIFGKKQPIGQA